MKEEQKKGSEQSTLIISDVEINAVIEGNLNPETEEDVVLNVSCVCYFNLYAVREVVNGNYPSTSFTVFRSITNVKKRDVL